MDSAWTTLRRSTVPAATLEEAAFALFGAPLGELVTDDVLGLLKGAERHALSAGLPSLKACIQDWDRAQAQRKGRWAPDIRAVASADASEVSVVALRVRVLYILHTLPVDRLPLATLVAKKSAFRGLLEEVVEALSEGDYVVQDSFSSSWNILKKILGAAIGQPIREPACRRPEPSLKPADFADISLARYTELLTDGLTLSSLVHLDVDAVWALATEERLALIADFPGKASAMDGVGQIARGESDEEEGLLLYAAILRRLSDRLDMDRLRSDLGTYLQGSLQCLARAVADRSDQESGVSPRLIHKLEPTGFGTLRPLLETSYLRRIAVCSFYERCVQFQLQEANAIANAPPPLPKAPVKSYSKDQLVGVLHENRQVGVVQILNSPPLRVTVQSRLIEGLNHWLNKFNGYLMLTLSPARIAEVLVEHGVRLSHVEAAVEELADPGSEESTMRQMTWNKPSPAVVFGLVALERARQMSDRNCVPRLGVLARQLAELLLQFFEETPTEKLGLDALSDYVGARFGFDVAQLLFLLIRFQQKTESAATPDPQPPKMEPMAPPPAPPAPISAKEVTKSKLRAGLPELGGKRPSNLRAGLPSPGPLSRAPSSLSIRSTRSGLTAAQLPQSLDARELLRQLMALPRDEQDRIESVLAFGTPELSPPVTLSPQNNGPQWGGPVTDYVAVDVTINSDDERR